MWRPSGDQTKTQTTKHGSIWPVLTPILFLILGVPLTIITIRALKDVTPAMMQVFLGGAMVLVIMVVVVGCMCAFIVVYSRLRRVEDAEDDRQQLDLLRTAYMSQAGAGRGSVVNVTPQSAPQGQMVGPGQGPWGQGMRNSPVRFEESEIIMD